ncbi:MAG: GNAT family N-acetyltransferase [Burkholderiaceae bacterium]
MTKQSNAARSSPFRKMADPATSKVIARLAQADDLAAVLCLYKELRPADPELSAERAAALWREVTDGRRSVVVVVEVGGSVVATCMLALIANLASDGRQIGLIEHVITAEAFRQRGLAKRALAFALEWAWDVPCCKVLLLSGTQRHEAHRLYQAVGFCGDVEKGFVIKAPLST